MLRRLFVQTRSAATRLCGASRRQSLSFAGLLVAACGTIAAAPVAGRHQWKTVRNATFGYSACYPADLFRPVGVSLNVGGHDYVGRGGARLRISGWANQNNDSLAITAQQTIPNSFASRRTVTYKVIKPDWAVLSGTLPDGRSFYQRVIRKEGDFAFFFVSYPRSSAGIYDPIVARLGQCLR